MPTSGDRRLLPVTLLVVRGWASSCGHDVLPLSLDDPGGGGRPPAGPAPMQREVAGEMDIGDIEVFIGTGRR